MPLKVMIKEHVRNDLRKEYIKFDPKREVTNVNRLNNIFGKHLTLSCYIYYCFNREKQYIS